MLSGLVPDKFFVRYDNDFQEDGGSSLEINCDQGIIVIKLRTPHRGKTEVEKDNVDYKTLHQVRSLNRNNITD